MRRIILFLLVVVLVYSSTALTFKKIKTDHNKVELHKDGNRYLSFELINHTSASVSEFESVLKITPHKTIRVNNNKKKHWSILYKYAKTPNLADQRVYLLQNKTIPYLIRNINQSSTLYFDSEGLPVQEVTYFYTRSSRTEERWVPFSFTNFIFQTGKDYFIKLTGKAKANAPVFVDWILNAENNKITEFAWWNNSFSSRAHPTFTNNENRHLSSHPVVVESFHCSNCQSNGQDIRVVIYNSSEIPFGLQKINASYYNISFKLNISALSTNDSVDIYFSSASATAKNISWDTARYNFYEDFEDDINASTPVQFSRVSGTGSAFTTVDFSAKDGSKAGRLSIGGGGWTSYNAPIQGQLNKTRLEYDFKIISGNANFISYISLQTSNTSPVEGVGTMPEHSGVCGGSPPCWGFRNNPGTWFQYQSSLSYDTYYHADLIYNLSDYITFAKLDGSSPTTDTTGEIADDAPEIDVISLTSRDSGTGLVYVDNIKLWSYADPPVNFSITYGAPSSSPDSEPPTYSRWASNHTATFPKKNDRVNFSAVWSDNIGMSMCWLEHNATGSMTNTTPQTVTSQCDTIIKTTLNNASTFWARQWANDTNSTSPTLNINHTDWIYLTVNNSAPTAPALSSPANATVITKTYQVISWSASTDSDGNSLTYYVFGDNTGTPNTLLTKTTTTSYNWTGLSADQEWYYWRVVASDGGLNSTTSNTRAIQYNLTTTPEITGYITLSNASIIEQDSINVTITVNCANGDCGNVNVTYGYWTDNLETVNFTNFTNNKYTGNPVVSNGASCTSRLTDPSPLDAYGNNSLYMILGCGNGSGSSQIELRAYNATYPDLATWTDRGVVLTSSTGDWDYYWIFTPTWIFNRSGAGNWEVIYGSENSSNARHPGYANGTSIFSLTKYTGGPYAGGPIISHTDIGLGATDVRSLSEILKLNNSYYMLTDPFISSHRRIVMLNTSSPLYSGWTNAFGKVVIDIGSIAGPDHVADPALTQLNDLILTCFDANDATHYSAPSKGSIECANSTDGEYWKRTNWPALNVSRNGADWDAAAAGASWFVRKGDKLHLFYNGQPSSGGNWQIGYATTNIYNVTERINVSKFTRIRTLKWRTQTCSSYLNNNSQCNISFWSQGMQNGTYNLSFYVESNITSIGSLYIENKTLIVSKSSTPATNATPSISANTWVPVSPLTTQTLTYNITVLETEGDTVKYYYWTRINGAVNSTYSNTAGTVIGNNTNTNILTIPSSQTSEGNTYKVTVLVGDGNTNSSQSNATIYVNTTTPSINSFTVNTTYSSSFEPIFFRANVTDSLGNTTISFVNVTIGTTSFNLTENTGGGNFTYNFTPNIFGAYTPTISAYDSDRNHADSTGASIWVDDTVNDSCGNTENGIKVTCYTPVVTGAYSVSAGTNYSVSYQQAIELNNTAGATKRRYVDFFVNNSFTLDNVIDSGGTNQEVNLTYFENSSVIPSLTLSDDSYSNIFTPKTTKTDNSSSTVFNVSYSGNHTIYVTIPKSDNVTLSNLSITPYKALWGPGASQDQQSDGYALVSGYNLSWNFMVPRNMTQLTLYLKGDFSVLNGESLRANLYNLTNTSVISAQKDTLLSSNVWYGDGSGPNGWINISLSGASLSNDTRYIVEFTTNLSTTSTNWIYRMSNTASLNWEGNNSIASYNKWGRTYPYPNYDVVVPYSELYAYLSGYTEGYNVEIGNKDGVSEWNKKGIFNSKSDVVINPNTFNTYLDTCIPNSSGDCNVPIHLISFSNYNQTLQIHNIHINRDSSITKQYNYTRSAPNIASSSLVVEYQGSGNISQSDASQYWELPLSFADSVATLSLDANKLSSNTTFNVTSIKSLKLDRIVIYENATTSAPTTHITAGQHITWLTEQLIAGTTVNETIVWSNSSLTSSFSNNNSLTSNYVDHASISCAGVCPASVTFYVPVNEEIKAGSSTFFECPNSTYTGCSAYTNYTLQDADGDGKIDRLKYLTGLSTHYFQHSYQLSTTTSSSSSSGGGGGGGVVIDGGVTDLELKVTPPNLLFVISPGATIDRTIVIQNNLKTKISPKFQLVDPSDGRISSVKPFFKISSPVTEIQAGESVQYQVSINFPKDSQVTKYGGTLLITASGHTGAISVPIKVTVFGAIADLTKLISSMFDLVGLGAFGQAVSVLMTSVVSQLLAETLINGIPNYVVSFIALVFGAVASSFVVKQNALRFGLAFMFALLIVFI